MAKRKRLEPPQTDYMAPDTPRPMAQPFAPAPIAGVAGDASATAAATELAEAMQTARRSGRMVIELPLSEIDTAYLVRDRVSVDAGEMDALVASLRARGQQTPIEVVDLGADTRPRYGLISGWRRLQALSRIAREDGAPAPALALLRRPDESSDAYLAMVEENEIRVGLSYFERARIALKAVEQGAFPDLGAALSSLFHAASKAKRSKIRSFVTVVDRLGDILHFPEALGERTGLALVKALDADPTLPGRLRKTLSRARPQDGASEQALIAETIKAKPPEGKEEGPGPDYPLKSRVAEGVDLTIYENGSALLSGPGVTERLRAELGDWLSARLGG